MAEPLAQNETDVAAHAAAADHLLEINNIEVIYNHVILVLKGVSLTVPKAVSYTHLTLPTKRIV